MRIALCLSGELRTFAHCGKQIKHHLIDRYGIEDVFCHYWEDHTTKTMWGGDTEIPDVPESTDEILQRLYAPKEIQHEPCPWQMIGGLGPKDEAEHHEWMRLIRTEPRPDFLDLPEPIRNWFSAYAKAVFHSQAQCARLKQKYGPYDLVIRTRYDIAFNRWLPSLEDLFYKMNEYKILVEWDNLWIYDSATHDLMTIGLHDNIERIQQTFKSDPFRANGQGNGILEHYQSTWMWMNDLRDKQDGLASGLFLVRSADSVNRVNQLRGLK